MEPIISRRTLASEPLGSGSGKLNFGYIQEYNFKKGIGYISCDLDSVYNFRLAKITSQVSFHIRLIKAKSFSLGKEIDRCGELKNKDYCGTSFWYETEINSTYNQEKRVSQIWLDKNDIPVEKLNRLVTSIEHRWYHVKEPISQKLDKFIVDFFGEARKDELNKHREEKLPIYLAEEERRKKEAADYLDEKKRKEEELQKQRVADRLSKEESRKKEIATRLIEQEIGEKELAVKIERILEHGSEQEILEFLKSANDLEVRKFWSDARLFHRLEYKEILWDLAKPEIKQKVITKYFSSLSYLDKAIVKIETYPHAHKMQIDPSEAYKNLNNLDRELAKLWAGEENIHELTKMLSARAGEKFVLRCYSNLGYVVKDISIQQLSNDKKTLNRSLDWTKYDLLLNNKIAIDVKNARRKPSANQAKYSEFCVRKFKNNREDEVIIAGVLSPYIKPEEFEDTSKCKYTPKRIIFLGEVANSTVENLEKVFLNNNLKSITMPRNSTSKYIPPWLFDYPNYFYQNQIEAINSLKEIQWEDSDIPNWEDLQHLDRPKKYFKVFLFAGINPPEKWTKHLEDWEKRLIKTLLASQNNLEFQNNRVSLPHLFMLLLSHFLEMISINCEAYHPSKYCDLLLPFPGINDPLNLIEDLCITLTTLWDNRAEMKIQDFSYFKFDGRGILRGKKSSETHLTTILAYCGGWKGTTGGTCGFFPLLRKQHEQCTECRWLICPECRYCSCKKGFMQKTLK
jgi:hypothetical protein